MNNEWLPPVGELVTRVQIGPTISRYDICFRDSNDPQHYKQIARIVDFIAEPYHSSFVECIRTHNDTTPDGGVITRHPTRYEELIALRKLWVHKQVTFDSWLNEGLELDCLSEVTKARLKYIYQR